MSNIQSIFHNFIGSWSLIREITDLQINEISFAKGNAEFSKTEDENILQYNESGTVNLKGKEYNFYRKYKYELHKDEIWIRLDDTITKGKIFQKLIPDCNSQFVGSQHICKNDLHNGKYNFLSPSQFEITYSIDGDTHMKIKTIFSKNM